MSALLKTVSKMSQVSLPLSRAFRTMIFVSMCRGQNYETEGSHVNRVYELIRLNSVPSLVHGYKSSMAKDKYY